MSEQAELDEAYRIKICNILIERIEDTGAVIADLIDEIDAYDTDESHEGDLGDARWNLDTAYRNLGEAHDIVEAERDGEE